MTDLELQPLFETLTPREQMFVLHPDVMKDPVSAAVAVGYSESTAKSRAHAMRKSLMFYIRPVTLQRFEALDVNAAKVREELTYIAFANITDYYDTVDTDDDTVKVWKDPTRLPAHMQRAIRSIDYGVVTDSNGVNTQFITNIVLHDKQSALRELADVLGMKDPKSRQPLDDPGSDDGKLLDSLEPEELEVITAMYAKASSRLASKVNKKRDQRALPGVAIRGKNEKA